jgi:excisionase family DNA binding protein
MQSREKQSRAVQSNRQYLTIREVAQEYGNSAAFWRKQILKRGIPFVKAGSAVKIARQDIEHWHNSRRVTPEMDVLHET